MGKEKVGIAEQEGNGCGVKAMSEASVGEAKLRVRNQRKPLFGYTFEFEKWFCRQSKKNIVKNIMVITNY